MPHPAPAALRSPVIVDLRNIYRPADLAAKGLTYVSVRMTAVAFFAAMAGGVA